MPQAEMHDTKDITAVALDVVDRHSNKEYQESLAELILLLLERDYQVFLWSSSRDDDLGQEDFTHAHLAILNDMPPFPQGIMESFPVLATRNTLWVTDNRQVQAHLRKSDSLFCYLRGSASTSGGFKLLTLGELTVILNPMRHVMQNIEAALKAKRMAKAQAPLLVGIGGPPASGYQQFALDMKGYLESCGYDLVEMLNLNPLMMHAEQEAATSGADALWISDGARDWVLHALLGPLATGGRVYVEALPDGLPQEFAGHFPLFVAEGSVLLVMAEMLFLPALQGTFDLSVLLDISPAESTRRLYEIPRYQEFDAKFEEQYLRHEGRRYSDYLKKYAVAQHIDFHLDANNPHAFFPRRHV